MQMTTSSQSTKGSAASKLRISFIIIGYLIALFGVLTTFRIPLAISLLTMTAGFVVVTLASRGVCTAPRVTWRVGLVWVVGSAMIFALLLLIGEDKVQHWTPHPAGYQVAWFICLVAFRHLRQLLAASQS